MNNPIDIERQIRALGGEGILTPKDLDEFKAGEKEVLYLMLDGNWHDAEEIRKTAGSEGVPASEGLRRLRALYSVLQVENRVKIGAKRAREYRAVKMRLSHVSVMERLLEEYSATPFRAWLIEIYVATTPSAAQRRIPVLNVLKANRDALLEIIKDVTFSQFHGREDDFINAFQEYWDRE